MLHELARRLPEWNGSPTDIQGGPVARGWEMILRVANEEIRVVAPSEALAIADEGPETLRFRGLLECEEGDLNPHDVTR
jgi:hypothetical protein